MSKLKPLTYQKRTRKPYVIWHLKFNSWLKKACVIRMHPLSISNVLNFFTKRLPKNLKDFANKRQVKHTSTVLEPSIPFLTLVKLVDAEDIADDKIRTHDLALEVNSITIQIYTQTLEPSSKEQLLFTQPKDPNNKNKPAHRKNCSYCHRTDHSISACFKKQRDDEDKRDAYARSKSPQKSFVQYFRSRSNDRIKHYDNRYKSQNTSRDNSYKKTY